MDPASAAAFQQMQQQMQQQAQMVQQLQQALLAQQPAHAPAAPAAPRVERPRLPPAPAYDGRSAAALDGWLRELQQQFSWYAMNDDASQIRFAGALLKGTALDWWASLPDAPAAGAAADTAKPTTFATFVERLRGRFQPINSAQTARVHLDGLRQGAKQSVQDYISAFRTLLVRVPDMSEGDRVHRFLQGLRPSIATQLRVNGVSTLDASIAMAARVGSIVEQGALPSSFGPSPAAAAAASSSDMDLSNIEGLDASTLDDASGSPSNLQAQFQQLLNALRTDRSPNRSYAPQPKGRDVASAIGKRFKLTPEQVREHFDKNQCFNCDGIGYSSRSCSKPPKK